MKSIKTKFKINLFTYFFLLIAFASGFFKNTLIILIIILFHELGHILVAKYYHYPILKVEIFPFGGMTTIEKKINTPLKQEIKIAMAGCAFQIILFLFFSLLYKCHFILDNTYEIFQNYNKLILLFNLLPMAPLDGSIIMHSLLERFFNYQKAYRFYLICSIVTLILFFTFHTIKSLNNYMIITFLFFKIYDAFQKRKYYQNKFYLERFLYDIPYERVKSHSYPNLKELQKDTLHFFWKKDRYLHEKEYLCNYYKSIEKRKN